MSEVHDERGPRFWAQFAYSNRMKVQAFTNQLQESNFDVTMFTARKAACFGDVLRLVRAWTPHGDTCSDKALEFDTSWLEGRRVLVVDDVVGTGATADRVLSRLHEAAPSEVAFLPMASRKEWPNALRALRARYPDVSIAVPSTSGGATADLGEELVRSIASIPRAYNLDWPVLSGWTLTSDELDSVIAHSGWRAVEVSSPFQVRLGLRIVTLEPHYRDLRTVLPRLDAPSSTLGLVKIRLYCEPTATGRYLVSLMPLVAFDRLAYDDIPRLSSSVGLLLSSRNSDVGVARVAQYLASLQMCRQFEGTLGPIFRLPPLFESTWQWSIGFGPGAPSVGSEPPIRAADMREPDHLRRGPLSFKQAADLERDLHYARFQLSSHLWGVSATSDRRRARERLVDATVPQMVEFLSTAFETRSVSVSEMADVLTRAGLGESSAILVSAFLDEAIDNGITVPSMRSAEHSLDRVFRAGETIEFAMREQRLFHVLISEILDRDPDVRIGKILLEKVLVLAVRYGAQRPSLLKPVMLPLGSSILTIAYSRYGSISTTDPRAVELPLASTDTHTLGRELDDMGVISWRRDPSRPRSDAWVVSLGPTTLPSASAADEAPFRRLGALVAEILHGNLVTRRDFELFVVLCNGSQVPFALAAELRQTVDGLSQLRAALTRTPPNAALLKRLLARPQWAAALASGLDKLEGLARGVVTEVDNVLRSSLSRDRLIDWEEISTAVVSAPTQPGVQALVTQLSGWLIRTGLVVSSLRVQYSGTRKDSRVRPDLVELARRLGLDSELRGYEHLLGPPPADTGRYFRRNVEEAIRTGEYLLEEVTASHDRLSLHQPPERYEQAMLIVSPTPLTVETRSAIARMAALLDGRDVYNVHPLPPRLLGDYIAGFAIRNTPVLEVANHLMPYIDDNREFAACSILVIRRLGASRRLLRRTLNSYWYGAGFARMCDGLPAAVAALNFQRLFIVEGTD